MTQSPFALEALFTPAKRRLLQARLEAGLHEMGIEATTQQTDQLICYLGLLHKWNQRHNFTAVRDLEEMVVKHLLDSLAILPYLEGERIVDVGTGPGLPGVPLAVMCPNKKFTLLDSRQKTTHFLNQVRNLALLKNIQPVCQRVQDFHVSPGFSTMVSRAYAKLPQMISDTKHLLSEGGLLLAMKGEQEVVGAKTKGFEDVVWHPLSVPGLAAKRQVALIRKHTEVGGES